MSTLTSAESELYSLVHSLLTSKSEAIVGSDRRSELRRAYPRVQLLAPCPQDRMPSLSMFLPVHCCDISSRGFSFLMPQPPGFHQMIVALGDDPDFVFVAARITNYRPIGARTGRRYRVGATFTGRVEDGLVVDDRVRIEMGTPIERRGTPR